MIWHKQPRNSRPMLKSRRGRGDSQVSKEVIMGNQEVKQLVMQGYQRYQNKDISGLLELMADDIEWVGVETDEIPFAGVRHGKQEVAQYFSEMDGAQEALSFEPQNFIADGDMVAVTGSSRWTVKSTGQTYDNPWVHIFTIRDGKIARFEQHNDTASAAKAFRGMQTASPQAGQGATVH
ncbi:nuclear transport factor 2 family protein [Herbaspirillum sp. HC18]|nr:nuclear transport factor 2 family protein [Herbaspirillum sp. HC18]